MDSQRNSNNEYECVGTLHDICRPQSSSPIINHAYKWFFLFPLSLYLFHHDHIKYPRKHLQNRDDNKKEMSRSKRCCYCSLKLQVNKNLIRRKEDSPKVLLLESPLKFE